MSKDFVGILNSEVLNSILESVESMLNDAFSEIGASVEISQTDSLGDKWYGMIAPMHLEESTTIELQNCYQEIYNFFNDDTIFQMACRCFRDMKSCKSILIGTGIVKKSYRFKRAGILIYWRKDDSNF